MAGHGRVTNVAPVRQRVPNLGLLPAPANPVFTRRPVYPCLQPASGFAGPASTRSLSGPSAPTSSTASPPSSSGRCFARAIIQATQTEEGSGMRYKIAHHLLATHLLTGNRPPTQPHKMGLCGRLCNPTCRLNCTQASPLSSLALPCSSPRAELHNSIPAAG